MRRMLAGLMAAPMLACCAPSASAPEAPEGIAWIAIREINAYYDDADDPTNRPPLLRVPPPGMVVAVDVSGDGRPDWLINHEYDGTGQFCGTGGCRRQLYVSAGEGYVRAFDEQALEFSVTETGGAARVEVLVHHSHCVPENWNCRYAWTWDASARRLVPVSTADGRAPPDTPLFHPLDGTPD